MIEDLLRGIVGHAIREALGPLERELAALRAELAPARPRGMTRAEAAKALAVSTATVDRRIADGTLRYQRFGRSVRIFLEAPATDTEIAALVREARA